MHIRIHTGENLFYCHLCNKKFVRNSTLAAHIKSHSNKKPVICKLCNETFKNKLDFMAHNETCILKYTVT